MKKKNEGKSFFLKIIFVAFACYSIYVFSMQQVKINKYNKEYEYYEGKKQEEILRNEQLIKEKEEIGSNEYTEKIAREKLGLVMPNETIYMDATRY